MMIQVFVCMASAVCAAASFPGVNGAYSPDGSRIAFQRHNGHDFDLGVMERSSGKVEWVENGPGESAHPAWSRDGTLAFTYCNVTQTAYRAMRSKSSNGFNIHIWRDGHITKITEGRFFDSTPSFSPDGRTIYFASTRGSGNPSSQLWSVDVSASSPAGTVRLLHSPGAALSCGVSQPVVSPCGHYVAWAEFTDFMDSWRLVAAKADSMSACIDLTPFGMVAYAPCWHPDGVHVAFTGYREGDKGWFIYLMNVKSGALRRVCEGKNPSISPDGRHMLFDADGKIHERALSPDDLPAASVRAEAPGIERVPEKILLSLENPAIGDSGAIPPECADLGTDKPFFARSEVEWDGDASKYQVVFWGGWKESFLGCQIYFAKGVPHFATRAADGTLLSVSSGCIPPKGRRLVITGVRAGNRIYVSVDDGPPVARPASMGLLPLGEPAKWSLGHQMNPATKMLKVEFGTGWPANVPLPPSREELFR